MYLEKCSVRGTMVLSGICSLIWFLQFSLRNDTSEYPNHYSFGFNFLFELDTSSSPSLSADLCNRSMKSFSLVCRYVFLLPTGCLTTFTGVQPAALVTLQTVSVFRETNSMPRYGFPWLSWLSVPSFNAALDNCVLASLNSTCLRSYTTNSQIMEYEKLHAPMKASLE